MSVANRINGRPASGEPHLWMARAQQRCWGRRTACLSADRFLGGRGRLIFAMDATANRKPTWDRAARIQAAIFSESADLGGLEVQLCYYGGVWGFECSPWYQEAAALRNCMTSVSCTAELSQIGRVLRYAGEESQRDRVNALVFVGDCVEENEDELAGLAGQLGLLGVLAFVFQEGVDPEAEWSFRRIARLSGGPIVASTRVAPKPCVTC